MSLLFFKKENTMPLVIIFVVFILIIGAFYFTYRLKVAHDSFESYSKYLNCMQTSARTETTGICLLPTGESIKILKAENGRWYKNGSFAFP